MQIKNPEYLQTARLVKNNLCVEFVLLDFYGCYPDLLYFKICLSRAWRLCGTHNKLVSLNAEAKPHYLRGSSPPVGGRVLVGAHKTFSCKDF
ncbi:MAG: hypothetical protein A3A97_00065 [Candidatus Terrybacteria bacterium RIFCSPLOWO2_01_FULL_40_23]|uniref:Uncharacterized protein n=1 Tax=Candidatus Terrybacteria bacterium RIFCSPLOWO2_01_FULL_40_23 TaxID=1802366 RepID=A0A1G2PU45_9BACT|nr:MAG: hypothetical protein A3A97_00065 [Candidatus Terrybacteria bacterium RIFCSPLOWO2_01_FULL_40_23]